MYYDAQHPSFASSSSDVIELNHTQGTRLRDGGRDIGHSRDLGPVTPEMVEKMEKAVDALRDEVKLSQEDEVTLKYFGEPIKHDYDILKRRLPPDFLKDVHISINASVNGIEPPPVSLTHRIRRPWANLPSADPTFKLDNFCKFIEGIHDMKTARQVSKDPQMLAIALVRTVFESRTDWSANELNAIGTAVMRAYVPDKPNARPINELGAKHSLNFARHVSRSMNSLLNNAARYGMGPGKVLGAAAVIPAVPLVMAGTLILGHKEDKPENKLLKLGMEVMDRLLKLTPPSAMSTEFADACRAVEPRLSGGKKATDFREKQETMKNLKLMPQPLLSPPQPVEPPEPPERAEPSQPNR